MFLSHMFSTEFYEWTKITKIENLTIGHPLERCLLRLLWVKMLNDYRYIVLQTEDNLILVTYILIRRISFVPV